MSAMTRAAGLVRAFRTAGRAMPPDEANPESMRRMVQAICETRGVDDWSARFENAQIDGEGGRLNLEVVPAATPEAAGVMVFVPGTNAYALLYGEFLAALSTRGFHAVGVDPRGHGASDGPRGSYTLPQVVADLSAAVDWAQARFGGPTFVGGSSQGGIAAFYLSAARDDLAGAVCHNAADLAAPDRVELTRFGALGRAVEPVVRGLSRVMPELPVPMTGYLDLSREPVRGLGTARDALYADPALSPCVRLKALASLAGTPLPCPVESIATPMLFLHGEADTIFPTDYMRRLYDRLTAPKAWCSYPGLPHYLIVDHVDAFIEDVAEWMGARAADG